MGKNNKKKEKMPSLALTDGVTEMSTFLSCIVLD